MDTIDTAEWGAAGGFDISAVIVPDIESDAGENWRVMAADKGAAFRRGDWRYVGVIVTAARAGVDLGSDSIWGTEYGCIPGVSGFVNPLTDADYPYRADLIDNAVADARMRLTEITETAPPAEFEYFDAESGAGISDYELHERFDNWLDELGPAVIAGIEYSASRALRAVSDIDYRCSFSDWLDSELQDDRITETPPDADN